MAGTATLAPTCMMPTACKVYALVLLPLLLMLLAVHRVQAPRACCWEAAPLSSWRTSCKPAKRACVNGISVHQRGKPTAKGVL